MITPEIKQKLSKVYELVKSGGTDGEKAAAQNALDRLLDKYNLNGVDLNALDKSKYAIKYSVEMEIWLMERLVTTMLQDDSCFQSAYKNTWHAKEVVFELTYLDYITLSTSYEYFRRHMKAQWKVFCLPNLKRCRTTKSRNKRREELKDVFFSKYVIASKLFQPKELTTIKMADLSLQERKDRQRLADVEGGQYNRQMTSGLLLNQ